MPRPGPWRSRAEGIKTLLVALALVAIVAFFALTAIPAAQRPRLVNPSPGLVSPAATAHH